jgi:hypothetical protein
MKVLGPFAMISNSQCPSFLTFMFFCNQALGKIMCECSAMMKTVIDAKK